MLVALLLLAVVAAVVITVEAARGDERITVVGVTDRVFACLVSNGHRGTLDGLEALTVSPEDLRTCADEAPRSTYTNGLIST